MSNSSFDAAFHTAHDEAHIEGFKAADRVTVARQRARRALSPEQARRRRIAELRDAACWQPLAPRELCELRRLVEEEQAEQ